MRQMRLLANDNDKMQEALLPRCVSRHRAAMKRDDAIHKTGSRLRIATPQEEYRGRATGNMQRISGEVWRAILS